jgi:hypothetical protein
LDPRLPASQQESRPETKSAISSLDFPPSPAILIPMIDPPAPDVLPAPRPRGRPPKIKLSPSANATRHGILSTNPVINHTEKHSDWEDHLAGQIEALKPIGDLELVLTHRIALTLWRLNRVIGFERYALRPSERHINELAALSSGSHSAGFQLDRVFPTGSIEQVQRYEAHLHRMFLKDLHELEALQTRRRGDPTPLARVEIN